MSRCITANDRMPLYKWLCEAYEATSGMASRDIGDGNVSVNGTVIVDDRFWVKDEDVVIVCGAKTIVDIPIWHRDSVKSKK